MMRVYRRRIDPHPPCVDVVKAVYGITPRDGTNCNLPAKRGAFIIFQYIVWSRLVTILWGAK